MFNRLALISLPKGAGYPARTVIILSRCPGQFTIRAWPCGQVFCAVDADIPPRTMLFDLIRLMSSLLYIPNRLRHDSSSHWSCTHTPTGLEEMRSQMFRLRASLALAIEDFLKRGVFWCVPPEPDQIEKATPDTCRRVPVSCYLWTSRHPPCPRLCQWQPGKLESPKVSAVGRAIASDELQNSLSRRGDVVREGAGRRPYDRAAAPNTRVNPGCPSES